MKKVKIIALALALLLLSTLMISCACSENYQQLETLTAEFIDTLIADDKAGARALLDDIITEEEFEKFYPTLADYVQGVEEFELKQTAWQTKRSNGTTFRYAEYRMTSGEKIFTVVVGTKTEGKLCTFNIALENGTTTESSGAVAS